MEDKDLIQVENEQNLFRDKETGAILNTDSAGYAQYMRMKKRSVNNVLKILLAGDGR